MDSQGSGLVRRRRFRAAGPAPSVPITIDDEPEDIADLGALSILLEAFDVLREAVDLVRAHAKHFLLIQLTLVLPTIAIVKFAVPYLFGGDVFQHTPQRDLLKQPPPPEGYANLNSWGFDSFCRGVQTIRTVIGLLKVMIFSAVAQALPNSVILYSVRLIYRRERVAFLDVLRAVIPHLWIGLYGTHLLDGLNYFLVVILAMTNVIIYVQNLWTLILMLLVINLLVIPVAFCLEMILRVTSSVCILEWCSPAEATKKAIQMLQGKRFWTAWCVLWVPSWCIIFAKIGDLVLQPQLQSYVSDHRTWRGRHVVNVIARTIFFSQVSSLFAGVLHSKLSSSAPAWNRPNQGARPAIRDLCILVLIGHLMAVTSEISYVIQYLSAYRLVCTSGGDR